MSIIKKILCEAKNLTQFVDEVKTLQAQFEMRGLETEISFRQEQSTSLDRIYTDKRGEGLGSEFMAEFVYLLDEYGIICTLSPTDEYGMNLNKLKRFYNKFGFKDNKGRNKDFRFMASMIRLPK